MCSWRRTWIARRCEQSHRRLGGSADCHRRQKLCAVWYDCRTAESIPTYEDWFAEISLPDRSAVELNCHAIRGNDCALVPLLSPQMTKPVNTGPRKRPRVIQYNDI